MVKIRKTDFITLLSNIADMDNRNLASAEKIYTDYVSEPEADLKYACLAFAETLGKTDISRLIPLIEQMEEKAINIELALTIKVVKLLSFSLGIAFGYTSVSVHSVILLVFFLFITHGICIENIPQYGYFGAFLGGLIPLIKDLFW